MPNHNPMISRELLSHQAFLRRLAIDLVGKDADDLVQDVWQRALEKPPHHGHQLRGWLARVARNVAANRWRGEARRTERERQASARPASEDLEGRLELRKDLVEALDSLSPSCRETILLRYFEGLAPRDIAKRQGAPVATVKTRLRRGLGQLREALDKQFGGDRSTWMPAVTALAAPVGSGVRTGTLVIGWIAMGTKIKMSIAVVVAATCVYFVARNPQNGSPKMAALEPPVVDMPSESVLSVPASEGQTTDVVRRTVEEEPSTDLAEIARTHGLRLILEGVSDEDARRTTVTLTGVDNRRDAWPSHLKDTWQCQGVSSEFDLDPFFASVAGATNWDLQVDGLEVKVYHPRHLIERARVSLSSGVQQKSGRTIYETRVRLVSGAPHVFWPELRLSVRDAHTRAHLEDLELRCVPAAFMPSGWQQPGKDGPYTSLGSGLTSPIGILGGREADAPEDFVAGLALRPAAAEVPQLVELTQPEATDRGVVMYARAPGYAWGRIVLDVSTGAARELLLMPATTLNVSLSNVQLERYAALDTWATLCIVQPNPKGGEESVWFRQLDETFEAEGLRLDSLIPGEYAVSVELGGVYSWKKRPVLAREELSLIAGETHELTLALADAPAPSVLSTVEGVVSFPMFDGEEEVILQFFEVESYLHGGADVELSLSDLEAVGGALPTWSFRLEDLPVGLYQVLLWPFLKSWMIEIPEDGRDDVEFVIPELAEVLVETVDSSTGKRIPLQELRYGSREELPGKVHDVWRRAEFVEPGQFRFWTAPGKAFVSTLSLPSGLSYGGSSQDLDLVAGFQSVRFELAPVYSIRIEFRVGGAALPRGDDVYVGVKQGVRAIGHEGRVISNKLFSDRMLEVNVPGLYEISFEGVGTDRFHSIPPRRVNVRPGETTNVIVDLLRK